MLQKVTVNKKLVKELDFWSIIVVIALVVFGSLNIYSATHMKSGTYYLKAQLIWLVVGLLLICVILLFDYSLIKNYANIIYWFGIFLLILNDTLFKVTVNGASSWMKIGPIQLQPSEFARLGMIIMIAKQLDDMEGNINNIRNFVKLTIYALIPMVLIVIQPDMGMTMIYFFSVLGMYFISGLNLKIIGGGMAGLVGLVAIIWNSPLMEQYWKTRLTSFLNPESDELGSGNQLISSLIGIGSSGFWGKGFLKGTQVGGGFVPEDHTDFIFSVVGEEWGIVGAAFLVILYFILLYRFVKISRESKDIFGSVLCIGIVASMLFSILQNIGMTIGIMPITGITLPFMSYGGSSMMTNFIGLGLILSVGMRRKKINF
ncbi:rod shape-determining protein RodA [Clostridium fermenticellae]|uniref:Peptidoglycan glycosyltransferase RodA n=1 Tax=Clostridium fermenticellae TaxID=2068654 RepID=A0A386H2U1_9CLOT|nr:rod shape-determining protein RodA [Clostridium fermenticellae]AYD39888.1 rod shape-determining protein RodA [Clostridium fermenticellae]